MSQSAPTSDSRRWWGGALALTLAVTIARLIYIKFLCPYTLVEDECSYWDWSRHLEWSYYTKGPGIAWTIAAFTRLLGTSEFSVRIPAVLSAAVAMFSIAGLARDVSGLKRAAWYAAACFLLMPVFQLLALASTIDGPYAACWAAGSWAAWRALNGTGATARPRAVLLPWLTLGAAIGIGTLYKYTMLLLIPGLLIFVLFPNPKSEIRNPKSLLGLALAAATAAFLCLPIVIWNSHEHWPTIRHLLGHLHVSGGDKPVSQGVGGWHYNPMWTLGYIATQCLISGPVLVLVYAQVRAAWNARREDHAQWRGVLYLLCTSLPILIFYLLVSFATNPQGNWALAGLITPAALAGWRVASRLDQRGRVINQTRHAWRATLITGLVIGLGMLRLDLLAHLPGLGRVIPVGRFTGATAMGAHADRLAKKLHDETHQDPFVMAQHYGRASQLAFYMQGRPTVYCTSSLMMDGRLTPYDYWPETNLRHATWLIGRPAVMVGNTLEDWQPLFDRVEEIGTLEGDGKRNRPAFIGYNFRGFPKGGLRSLGAPELPEP